MEEGFNMIDTVMLSSGMTILFAIVAIIVGFVILRAMDKAVGFKLNNWLITAEARGNDVAIGIYLAGRIIAIFWFLGQVFS